MDSMSVLSRKYTVCEQLGSGSSGIIYRAIHTDSGNAVALKAPRKHDPSIHEAAKREYDMLKSLAPHPNIIRAVDFHNLEGEATLALEYFDGLSLLAIVKDSIVQESTARSLCISLFEAVSHLHAHSILHRDIKPENVLVSRSLSDLRLIDFNAAACLDHGEPLTPTGTELYKAPEVLLGQSCTKESDTWASGMCVFYMLSGHLPQDRNELHPNLSIKEVVHRPISFVAECWGNVSQKCRLMLEYCLAIEPNARPTLAELLKDPWVSDPLMRKLSFLSNMLPGSEAYIDVLCYLHQQQ